MLIILSRLILQEASNNIHEISSAIRAEQQLRKDKEDGDDKSEVQGATLTRASFEARGP
jgi:hypothetical protein